jgi:hypothetical protein
MDYKDKASMVHAAYFALAIRGFIKEKGRMPTRDETIDMKRNASHVSKLWSEA